ncbi:RNA polymerase sigma factor (sigma-70 family) [Methylobacterium sp. PvR107]|nr:RNA polymerase sigma factor (sigma-70 family) [Methylobacterium sp. PvR107]
MKTRISGTPSRDGRLRLAVAAGDAHGGPGLGKTAEALRGHVVTDRLMSERTASGRPKPLALLDTASLPAGVRDHLGAHLRGAYEALTGAQTPRRLLDLVAQLETALEGQSRERALVFRAELTKALPGLRAFALSLVADASRADDLVQETVLRAWASQDLFAAGSNLKAWLCTILRNQFYTECRKRKREIEDVDGAAAAQLTAPAAQEHGSDLQTVWSHIGKLPELQREALLLVGAQGLTYEAAAEVMGCQTGTVKSRVSRARAMLVAELA